MAEEIKRLKEQFGLIDHPEGGFYIEKWRGDRQSTFTTKTDHDGTRDVGTSIYYLLTSPNFISWHKHLSEEIFYWHAGGPMKVHLIDKAGNHSYEILGDGLESPEYVYNVVVPHETWYAAEITGDNKYVMFSAAVIPGFDFKDWIPGDRTKLLEEFPQHADIIQRLTKSSK